MRTMDEVSASDIGEDGARLNKPGFYHLLCEDIFDGIMPDGETSFDGMSVKLVVLSGDMKNATTGLLLPDGNMSHRDGGKFAKKKQSAFLIATNVLSPSDLTGKAISYDEQKARGMQFCASLKFKKNQDGTISDEYLDWDFAKIYHVDDPRAKSCVKDKDSLALIPKEYRHDASYFEPLLGKTQKTASQGQGGGGSAPQDLDMDGL